MSDLSHVGLELCFYCGAAKSVLLDRRLKDSLPHEGVYNTEPCDECAALMQQGVILISVREDTATANPYRTGNWCVVTDDLIERLIVDATVRSNILTQRYAFVPDSVWRAVGLPEGGQDV